MKEYTYVTLRQKPELKEEAAAWFHDKWEVPQEAYLECIEAYLNHETEYGWYLCLGSCIPGRKSEKGFLLYHTGEGKLRMLIDSHPNEDFYVMSGNRTLIKREKFERYPYQATAV